MTVLLVVSLKLVGEIDTSQEYSSNINEELITLSILELPANKTLEKEKERNVRKFTRTNTHNSWLSFLFPLQE